MSAKTPNFLASREPAQDRKAAAPTKRRSLDWVREVLGRQIRLEQGRKL